MNYSRKLLSTDDLLLLQNIYTELEKITIPTTFSSIGVKGHFHAVKTGTTQQKNARQTSFGLTIYRFKKQETSSSKKYPHIMPLFKTFMDSHYPLFKFNSVYVNRNTVVKQHLDSKNVGETILVGLGSYTDGKTVLYSEDGSENKFSIKTHSLKFNGSKIIHSSEPFEGTRYSLVFFNI